jgi:MOSC domain-containing protein YiiM
VPLVQTVNIGTGAAIRAGGRPTGIDKRPVTYPVEVRGPGPRGNGSGLVGDDVCDGRHHGGDDQAVYAYAREDLDRWATLLGRPLANGVFGENLTTVGVDVTGAVIGERWLIGDEVVGEVSVPRVPCGVFRTWMGERQWVKRFAAEGAPGAYLRVLTPGLVRSGDPIVITHRPGHGVDIGLVFRALTTRPDLLPQILAADELPDGAKDMARAAESFDLAAQDVD